MKMVVKVFVKVIMPGITGFGLSRAIVVPVVAHLTAGATGAYVMVVGVTGILTFALASGLSKWTDRLTERVASRIAGDPERLAKQA